MNAIIYRCPETGLCVDHWFEPADNGETFESVHCRVCNPCTSRKRDNGQSAGRSAGDGRAQFHLGFAMTDEQYQWDSPAIDRQSIALVLIVVVLALVLGTAAMWIGLR